MAQWELESQATNLILQCGLGSASWNEALHEVRSFTGSAGISMELYDAHSLTSQSFGATGVDESWVAEYLENYADANPRISAGKDLPVGGIISDYDFIDEKTLATDPFYSWLERTSGYRYFLGACVERDNGLMATLTLHRSRKQGHAGQEDLRTISRLSAVLRTAIGLSRTFPMTTDLQALETSARALILVNSAGSVVFINTEAERQAGLNDAYSLEAGGFRVLRRRDAEKLATITRSIVSGNALSAAFRLSRRSGQPDYIGFLSTLPIADDLLAPMRPRLAIAIIDPTFKDPISAEALIDIFGLTPAEARVAAAIAGGLTLTGASVRLRISIATARVHLSRIYKKTQCEGAADLSGLLARLTAAAPPGL